MGKKQFYFFQTAETGNRTPDSGVKGSGANHYPRAPARFDASTLSYKVKRQLLSFVFVEHNTHVRLDENHFILSNK